MTWKECRQVEERLRFIARLLDGEKIAGLCREFEGPGKNNGQREAKNQEKRQRGINCVGQAQFRAQRVADLQDQPSDDHVGDRNADDIASIQFPPN